MAAKTWSVGKVASVGGVSSSAVSQWLGRGGAKSSKSIGDFEVALRLQKESGYSAMWLAKGKGPKHAEVLIESTQENIDDSVSMSKVVGRNAKIEGNEGSPEEVSGDNAENESVLCQPIPTSMPDYSPQSLKAAVQLMGSLVGALDETSRDLMRVLLKRLVDNPDKAEELGERASGLLKVQQPSIKNKELRRALRGRDTDPVETKPTPLEH